MSQVQKGNEMIAALTGETPTLFRCPYGEYNDQIITTVRSLGVTPVQWDVDVLERVGVIIFCLQNHSKYCIISLIL
jgi:hypothetical protein